MKKSVKTILVMVLVVAVVLALGFVVGTAVDYFAYRMAIASMESDVETDRVTAKMDEIGGYLDAYFIDDYDPEKLEAAAADAAAEAMLEATGDRWSYYIPAEEMEVHNEQLYNSYAGIGVTVSETELGVQVASVTRGSPAEDAGMQKDDVLLKVDGTDVTEMTVDEVKALVRGEEGTPVKLTLLRNGSELEVTVLRAIIISPVAVGEMIEDRIGYITIDNFDYHCAEQTISCMEELLAQGAEALIFDVRFNPGGLKDELVEVLDVILPEGVLFRSLDYAGRQDTDYSDADCIDIPMAVLVNEDSYSAAEFFAAALQEYEAAVVVGMPTCGKGNFQYTFDLSDGSAIAISVGKYFTPKGKSLTDVGILPDIQVDLDDTAYYNLYYGALEYAEDPQLQAALEAMRQKIS